MLQKILYLLFIFLEFSGSNISIGGIALRYIVILLLLIVIFFENKKLYFDKIWGVYSLFILIFGLSCVMTGYLDKFLNVLLKEYFISFVGWTSTVSVLIKDRSFVKNIVLTILLIGSLDTLVTVSQFTFNASWYAPIERFFDFQSSEEFSDLSAKSMEFQDVMSGTIVGIFPNGVYNGYYLLFCSILSLVYLVRYKRLWLYSLPGVYLVGLFCCQQRSTMIISLIVTLWVSIKMSRNVGRLRKIIIVLGALLLIIYGYSSIMNYSENMGLRYSSKGLEDEGRMMIYSNTIDYIFSNPILPNIYELQSIKGHAPHNLFLNAYVYGGLISFIVIMWILYYQLVRVLKIVRNKLGGLDSYYYIFAFAWIAFTLNGLLHNMSIITGEFMIWIIWGVLTVFISPKYKIERE